MFIETGTKLDEYRTLSTIETRLRVLDDDSETEVLTETSECHGCCTLEYVVGLWRCFLSVLPTFGA
jgi:hypothetical protein